MYAITLILSIIGFLKKVKPHYTDYRVVYSFMDIGNNREQHRCRQQNELK